MSVITDISFISVRQLEDNYWGLFAEKNFAKGEIIIAINGIITNRPTKYSIQTDKNKHIDVLQARWPIPAQYFWIFINHSCDPNGYINSHDLTFCSLRHVEKGEQLFFNYNTTEWMLADPFKCECNSRQCSGEINGYNFLSTEERKSIVSITALHLRRSFLLPKKSLLKDQY